MAVLFLVDFFYDLAVQTVFQQTSMLLAVVAAERIMMQLHRLHEEKKV